jgi:hypothetical protein
MSNEFFDVEELIDTPLKMLNRLYNLFILIVQAFKLGFRGAISID